MKYCPNCGAEYRPGHQECSHCGVPLVDHSPEAIPESRPVARPRKVVFRSGRRIEAELVRARLEADGLEALVWSSGLGPWRMESALTEVTGIANDFNSHRVVVDADDEERALEVLQEVVGCSDSADDVEYESDAEVSPTFLESMRRRWMLLVFATFFLLLIFVFGPPGI